MAPYVVQTFFSKLLKEKRIIIKYYFWSTLRADVNHRERDGLNEVNEEDDEGILRFGTIAGFILANEIEKNSRET